MKSSDPSHGENSIKSSIKRVWMVALKKPSLLRTYYRRATLASGEGFSFLCSKHSRLGNITRTRRN